MQDPASRFTPIEPVKTQPLRRGGVFAWFIQWLSAAYLKLFGWKMVGNWPKLPKAVVIAAPHTSNWDGLNMLASGGYHRVKFSWMGKAALGKGLFGGFMRRTGLIPIDRKNARDVVAQMVEAYATREELVLAVAPEGTRSATKEWKSGFHRIARAANVPLIITILDYGRKTVFVDGVLVPGDDFEADLAFIQSRYEGARGKIGGKFLKGDMDKD